MKKPLFLLIPLFFLAALLPLAAQEVPEAAANDPADGSFGGFDSFAASPDTASAVPAVSPLTFGAEAKLALRALVGGDACKGYFNIGDNRDALSAVPSLKFNLGYARGAGEFSAKLAIDKAIIQKYPADIIEELTMRAYVGDFVLEGGKMKIVWGKGDKLHVLDNFNANDFTDFIIPDYIDRRLAEPMLRAVWNSPFGLRAEAVYTPLMSADRFAADGIWAPQQSLDLTATVTPVLGAQAAAALQSGNVAGLLAIMDKADKLVPATTSFDYGQAGFRLTGTAGSVDLGASYYYGHYKQPSVDWSGYSAAISAGKTAYMGALQGGKSPAEAEAASANAIAAFGDAALPALHYDRLQVFGLEGAAALWRFNLRAELAYYLTDDTAGTDPWVHNNSINWVLGFDIDLPVHNVNLNVQNIGAAVLRSDKIVSPPDADYNTDGRYTNNKLLFALTDTFLHEKLKLECDLLWGIERADLLVLPKITYTIVPALDISLSGLYITGKDNSEFAAYENNSFVQLDVKYAF